MGCGGSKEGDTPVYKKDSPDGDEVFVPSGPQWAECLELFKTYDTEKTGKISISKLEGSSMKVGPHQANLLKTLGDMDFNGDGYVEESEWKQYFATVMQALSEDELALVIADLKSAGG